MSILKKKFQVTLGLLLTTLLGATAWGEVNLPEQFQNAQTYAISDESVSGTQSYDNGKGTITNLSNNDSDREATGDGRAGFWIVGILINLSVLGWFLVWAVKEWRKKPDG